MNVSSELDFPIMANPIYKGVVNRKLNDTPLRIEPLRPRDSIIVDGLCNIKRMIITGMKVNNHFKIYWPKERDCR